MKEKAYIIGYMAVVAAVFTTGVTFAKIATQEQVRLNAEVRFQRVVLRVLGLTEGGRLSKKEVGDLFRRRVTEKNVQDLTVYTGYTDDEKRQVIGYAFPIGGMGLWSKIEGMLALGPDLDTIIGIDFTRQGETPGLGARITEEWFKSQFEGKSVTSRGKGGEYIRFVSSDKPLDKHEVHGITGATITTKGVESFLNRDIERIRATMKKGAP
ncbi:MAG: FMN-binding protein [Planctomycetes bacterium]|nr:FMN-binding protein [Planctomycetota bacterium]